MTVQMASRRLWARYEGQEYSVGQVRQDDDGVLTQVTLVGVLANAGRVIAMTDPAELGKVNLFLGGEGFHEPAPDEKQVLFINESYDEDRHLLGGVPGVMEHVAAGLVELEDGQTVEFCFKRQDMTRAEIDAMPVV